MEAVIAVLLVDIIEKRFSKFSLLFESAFYEIKKRTDKFPKVLKGSQSIVADVGILEASTSSGHYPTAKVSPTLMEAFSTPETIATIVDAVGSGAIFDYELTSAFWKRPRAPGIIPPPRSRRR